MRAYIYALSVYGAVDTHGLVWKFFFKVFEKVFKKRKVFKEDLIN